MINRWPTDDQPMINRWLTLINRWSTDDQPMTNRWPTDDQPWPTDDQRWPTLINRWSTDDQPMINLDQPMINRWLTDDYKSAFGDVQTGQLKRRRASDAPSSLFLALWLSWTWLEHLWSYASRFRGYALQRAPVRSTLALETNHLWV